MSGLLAGSDASLTRAALAYPACQTPVHVLQGDRDLVVNPAVHGRPLAAILPNGRFTWLRGLGHMAHRFAPGVVADAVEALVRHAGETEQPATGSSL